MKYSTVAFLTLRYRINIRQALWQMWHHVDSLMSIQLFTASPRAYYLNWMMNSYNSFYQQQRAYMFGLSVCVCVYGVCLFMIGVHLSLMCVCVCVFVFVCVHSCMHVCPGATSSARVAGGAVLHVDHATVKPARASTRIATRPTGSATAR